MAIPLEQEWLVRTNESDTAEAQELHEGVVDVIRFQSANLRSYSIFVKFIPGVYVHPLDMLAGRVMVFVVFCNLANRVVGVEQHEN